MQTTASDIATVLRLQQQAYELLMWVSHRSYIDPILDRNTIDIVRDPVRCQEWVIRLLKLAPRRLRPAAEENEVLARLFASFFQTSFRIEAKEDYEGRYYRIVANKDQAAGKNKLASRKTPRTLEKKRKNEATHLRMRSLVELFGDDQSAGFWERAYELLADKELRLEASIWAYAFGLLRRAEGENDGPAMHRLWKDIDQSTREHLTAERVELAKTKLINGLLSLRRVPQSGH